MHVVHAWLDLQLQSLGRRERGEFPAQFLEQARHGEIAELRLDGT